jgi:hypothetical protein
MTDANVDELKQQIDILRIALVVQQDKLEALVTAALRVCDTADVSGECYAPFLEDLKRAALAASRKGHWQAQTK